MVESGCRVWKPPRWRACVREYIIEPAIGRDVLALGTVRRPVLLRQVFTVAAASTAQIISLQKLQGQLQDSGVLETVAHYLGLLKDAYLIAPLEKCAQASGFPAKTRNTEQRPALRNASKRRS